MEIVLALGLIIGIEGLLIGSFLNVVIDRLPFGKSLGGRSSCDECGRKLSPLELVPVISYVLQKGKSRCCKKKLKAQYSLVEGFTGIIFFLTSSLVLSQARTFSPVVFLSLTLLLVGLSVSIVIVGIDFYHHIIPDILQIILFVSVLLYQFSTATFLVSNFGIALIVALPILILYLVTGGRGMGYGDIKLQVTLGLLLGLMKGFLGLYISFLTGALYGVFLILQKKANRKSQVAFGPFLLLGAWIAFFFGDQILIFIRGFLLR